MTRKFIGCLLIICTVAFISGCAKKEVPQTRVTSFKDGEFIVGDGKITAGVYNITPLDRVAHIAIWRGDDLRVNEILFLLRDDEIKGVKLKDGDRIIAGDGEVVFEKPLSDD